VFLALEEQESASLSNPALGASLPGPTRAHLTAKKRAIGELHREPLGEDLLDLVRDFLNCYQLEYTQALLNTEADVVRDTTSDNTRMRRTASRLLRCAWRWLIVHSPG